MKRFPIALALAAFTLVGAGAAYADPVVNGVAVNTTVANGSTNAAIGLLSEARQAIGTINGDTQVNGVLSNTTVTNGSTNAAIGLLSEACQTIGTVGSVGEACDD